MKCLVCGVAVKEIKTDKGSIIRVDFHYTGLWIAIEEHGKNTLYHVRNGYATHRCRRVKK